MAPNSTYGRKCGFIDVNMLEFRKASNNVICIRLNVQCLERNVHGSKVISFSFVLFKAGDFTVLRANYKEPILTEMYSILFFIIKSVPFYGYIH